MRFGAVAGPGPPGAAKPPDQQQPAWAAALTRPPPPSSLEEAAAAAVAATTATAAPRTGRHKTALRRTAPEDGGAPAPSQPPRAPGAGRRKHAAVGWDGAAWGGVGGAAGPPAPAPPPTPGLYPGERAARLLCQACGA